MSSQPRRLSPRVRVLLEDESNAVFVSMASFWQMAIKISIGKLDLGEHWMGRLQGFLRNNAVSNLCVPNIARCWPRYPFFTATRSTSYIAQALCEKQILISKDGSLRCYEVEVVW